MKKSILAVIIGLVAFCLPIAGMAASVMTPTVYAIPQPGGQMIIKVACTAHTDGTFDSTQITGTHISKSTLGLRAEYWQLGYYLYEVWAVNPASGHPTVAGAVTITDETGAPLLASGELALSTSASGIAEAALGKFRAVNSKMTITVGDTGDAANTFDLYIKLVR